MINSIIEIAKSYIGQKELANNSGWEDKRFQELMEDCGWQHGQAWCAYFCELVWKQAYKDNPDLLFKLDKLFAAGAIKTYENFKSSRDFIADKHCVPGSIAIWQHYVEGKASWQGHAGIVISEICSHEFDTIEGNTNSGGGREGIEVAQKIRLLDFNSRNGLVLRGFIHPKEL